MRKEYELHILTNKYAGNFEREMCAYLTGNIGDCGVGDEEAEIYKNEEEYRFYIRQVPDENGTERPVALMNDSNGLIIFIEKPLTEEEIEILKRRLDKYSKENDIEVKYMKVVKKEIKYNDEEILL